VAGVREHACLQGEAERACTVASDLSAIDVEVDAGGKRRASGSDRPVNRARDRVAGQRRGRRERDRRLRGTAYNKGKGNDRSKHCEAVHVDPLIGILRHLLDQRSGIIVTYASG
jgi:hypothetical protein